MLANISDEHRFAYCTNAKTCFNVHIGAILVERRVPLGMCRRTEGTPTTARRCCGVFRDSGAGYKTAYLLTYLLTSVGSAF